MWIDWLDLFLYSASLWRFAAAGLFLDAGFFAAGRLSGFPMVTALGTGQGDRNSSQELAGSWVNIGRKENLQYISWNKMTIVNQQTSNL